MELYKNWNYKEFRSNFEDYIIWCRYVMNINPSHYSSLKEYMDFIEE